MERFLESTFLEEAVFVLRAELLDLAEFYEKFRQRKMKQRFVEESE